jgi:NAD(P)-dependent dehydrogenase (short-subunit alcohol dehydrogenase family)
MDLGLDGRTALVTGGRKGIGLAIAERLLREGGRSWSVAATRNSSNESAPICPNMDRSASAGQTLRKSEPSL